MSGFSAFTTPAPVAARDTGATSAVPAVELRSVTKTFTGGATALAGVSLSLAPGEFTYLIGHSGSGKSTLLRLLHRAEVATAGEVLVAGRDITSLRSSEVPRLRRKVSCIFQDYKLLPTRSVAANVAFALEVTGVEKSAIPSRVEDALAVVGLTERAGRLPAELSGGEQQRVSIARAIVAAPLILLADEPTGNLDPAASLAILELLEEIARRGTTVLIATHDETLVNSHTHRVIELAGGRVHRDERYGSYDADEVA